MDKLLQSDAERAEEKESEGQQSMMMGKEQLRLCAGRGGTVQGGEGRYREGRDGTGSGGTVQGVEGQYREGRDGTGRGGMVHRFDSCLL